MMMLGFAWQRGAIPLSKQAVEQAIELNGVAVDANRYAFALGRLAAWQPDELDKISHPPKQASVIVFPESLETVVERCRADLTHYQNAAYARKYTDTVQAVLRAERALYPEAKPALALLVARMLHKLMASKDEYRSEEHTSELQSLMRI